MRFQGQTLLALAAASGLLTSVLVPGVSGASGPPDVVKVAAKGDRLAAPVRQNVNPVASMIVAKVAENAEDVVMRDREGEVVLRSSQELASTRVSKNVELAPPAARPASVAVAPPVPTQTRARIPVGCDRLVSPLVRSASALRIGRCVT